MTCVDRIKALCKEKRTPISRLEKDLGFGNGYIGQLRKGTVPGDRLFAIAEYLNVSTEFLLSGEETKKELATLSSDKLPVEFYSLSESEQKQVKDYISFLLSQRSSD